MVILLLSGCTPSPVLDRATAPAADSAESIPREGIDELARHSIVEYLRVSSEIAGDGGLDSGRIADVVTAEWAAHEETGFAAIRAMESVQRGTPTVSRFDIAAVRGVAEATEVIVYLCTSFDEVTVASPGHPAAPVATPVAFVTVYLVPQQGRLKVDAVTPQSDVSWCAEG